jgi:glycosyltransferase involved in cell wall biosynthesis
MRVLIATTQVPFVRGGAEIHAEGLLHALREAGHEAEIVAVPFKWYPAERIVEAMLACRLLDLTESAGTAVDRVIGLKFPAYLIPHPCKVLWILHQHRSAYELWDHELCDLRRFPNGRDIRAAIIEADRQLIPEAKAVFANSRNVAGRLKKYCELESMPLYHPPRDAARFYCERAEDYLFFPSRLCELKRQSLALEALARTKQPVRLKFAGAADTPSHAEQLRELAKKHHLVDRVEWLGQISDEEMRRQFARAAAIVYPPIDEDFGYVTLEAMLAFKPVVTCSDSGGPLEFVQHGKTGLVCEPTTDSLAAAFDTIWKDHAQAAAWGKAGRALYESLDIAWPTVVRKLLA